MIDRDTYRSIKKMSREEIDLRVLESDIKAVKGIGEKHAEEIMQIKERHL